MKQSKLLITVFGNDIEPRDNLAVRLVPYLDDRFPMIDFKVMDPTESLEPPGDPWVILDVGVGIDKITVIEDLDQLDYVKGLSAHDFDVYMDLKIRQKLKQLPKIKIILLPNQWGREKTLAELKEFISIQK